uniref:F-box associated domain-containing protein n=1 Tax=Leersia perrieri TaxID=77586 RepID=A0A0D9XKA2_9ORYZ
MKLKRIRCRGRWDDKIGAWLRRCRTTCSRRSSAASRRAASPCPPASASHGATPSTGTAFCSRPRTSSRARSPASSSTSTAFTTRNSSPFLPSTDEFRLIKVEDHCNEYPECVVNPATGWWSRLPPQPPPREKKMDYSHVAYLVFDAVVSPHYEGHRREKPDDVVEASEWPPASYTMPVFSSMEGLWQERSFLREGEAACTIADMRSCLSDSDHRMQSIGEEHSIISFSSDKYQVIKPPEYSDSCLLSWKVKRRGGCLKVWILDETCGKIRWKLKHNKDIKPILLGRNNRQGLGPWILQDINHRAELKRGLAYHLNSSKIEDIGDLYPTDYDLELPNEQFITATFPYTPCLMRGLI